MANEKDTTTATPAAPAKKDLVSEIGTLTLARATAAFGKARALDVMHRVAAIGGNGEFKDVEFQSPYFGGLGMPNPDSIPAPDKEQFDRHAEGDFHYANAMEDYNNLKKTVAANRAAINDYYNSLKSA